MWKTLANLGLLGVLVPETHGGVGLGYGAAVAVAGEFGKALLTEPFCAVGVLAAHVLVDCGRDSVARDLLGGLVCGEVVPVVAWQENAFGLGSESVSTTFEPSSAGGSLNGRKEFVVGGLDATGFIVLARSEGGVGLYWAPRGSAGIKLEPYATADGGRHAAVTFESVQVAKDGVLAGPGWGLSILQRGLDVALIVTSAEMHGVASKLFELSLRYVGQRQQFGRLIASFQSVQHRASDSAMFLKITETVITAATAALAAGSAEQVSAMASRVKARSSSTALQIAKDAVQLHGAMGFTQECDVSLYLNRILVLSNWLGGSSVHRRRYAALHAQGQALRKAPST
jgi:alkylation response protein AidB-like acyl-CoA dehydrogenase